MWSVPPYCRFELWRWRMMKDNIIGVVNGPLKSEKSRQNSIPKSRNLAQPTNGSRSLRFCVCRSHICFSIKSLKFSVSAVSDFKMPVSASLGFTIRHPLWCADIAAENSRISLTLITMVSRFFDFFLSLQLEMFWVRLSFFDMTIVNCL